LPARARLPEPFREVVGRAAARTTSAGTPVSCSVFSGEYSSRRMNSRQS
jgi:hypothetical protein